MLKTKLDNSYFRQTYKPNLQNVQQLLNQLLGFLKFRVRASNRNSVILIKKYYFSGFVTCNRANRKVAITYHTIGGC